MTDGFTCTADPRCWRPALPRPASAASIAGRAQLAQMRHAPAAAVRATAWLLTQLHQPSPGTNGDELRCRELSQAAAREAEPG
jgi:hypothetical protein